MIELISDITFCNSPKCSLDPISGGFRSQGPDTLSMFRHVGRHPLKGRGKTTLKQFAGAQTKSPLIYENVIPKFGSCVSTKRLAVLSKFE